ncbi:MAG: gamma-glutamyl-gamma-aminobutyrate hydrolase PuuD, partial [Porticoccaceae bacterium]
DCWILGVQWHPEWQFESNKVSKAIFYEFGQQVRANMVAKSQ